MRLPSPPAVRVPTLVLVVAPLLVALMAPVAAAHDQVSGTPDVTIRVDPAGISDRSVVVRPGAIVAFVNHDSDRHRLRSRTRPGEFDTGDLEPGDRALVRFGSIGTVSYRDERTGAERFGGEIVVRDASSGAAASGGGGSTGSAAGGGAATPPRTATVRIADRAFAPTTVTVAVGGTVTWRNADDREHTATSSGKGGIASPVLQPGATYRRSFATAGTYAFLCAIHPEMRGSIRIVAAAGPAANGTAPDAARPKPTTAPTRQPAAAQPAAKPADRDARIVDFSFAPTPLSIEAGGRVTWTNRGQAPHTVSASAGAFDSGTLMPGQSFTQAFASPGQYAYVCAFHPQMAGTIEVAAASVDGAAPARVAPDAPSSSDPGSPGQQAVAPPAPSSTPAPASIEGTDAGPSPDPASATIAADDGPLDAGRLALIGAVVLLNVGAVLLFSRTVGGAARRRE